MLLEDPKLSQNVRPLFFPTCWLIYTAKLYAKSEPLYSPHVRVSRLLWDVRRGTDNLVSLSCLCCSSGSLEEGVEEKNGRGRHEIAPLIEVDVNFTNRI